MKKNKLFRMDEVFDLYKGKRLTKADMLDGTLNYIGAISDNNGVRQKIDAIKQFDGNCITVNYNGSVGEAFYQDQPFWASDDVNVLMLKNYVLNEKLALFLITIIRANKYRFSYGRKWTLEKMSESELSLPVDEYGHPDWGYMENYVSNLKYNHIQSKILHSTMEMNTDGWREFELQDLFDIKYGVNLELANCTIVDNPSDGVDFVARTSSNNGVVARVKEIDGIPPQPAGLITCAGGGSVLSTFVQPHDFYSGRDLYTLKAKEDISIYAKLFCCTEIQANKYRYNYGRQANKTMKNIILKLPVKANQMPDWNYMENYIRSLPYSDRI